MNRQSLDRRSISADPRVAATWLGAAVVLGCGMWLHLRGGPAAGAAGASGAAGAEPAQELEWVDRRLAAEQASGSMNDPRRAYRMAFLHWARAAGLAQHEYYRRSDTIGSDDHEQEYTLLRRQCLRRDASGDVAATREAAERALALLPAGPERVRALWVLSMACSVGGRRDEAIGALVEITRYQPHQAWVWSLLAQSYRARGDPGRQDLAEEQQWRIGAGHSLSAFITQVIRATPYARPAPLPPR